MHKKIHHSKYIKTFHFLPFKYKRHLLFDIGRLEALDNYVLDDTLHQLSFYEILFIEAGSGVLSLDENKILLNEGSLIFTSPGQLRKWTIENELVGYVLLFEKDFFNLFFLDEMFLYKFHFFHQHTRLPAIKLNDHTFGQCLRLVQVISQEFSNLLNDSDHLIRALLYQLLVTINRVYSKSHNLNNKMIHSDFHRFKRLLEKEFTIEHSIHNYTKLLNISPKTLNSICRQHSGLSAQQMINQKLISEIKKELILKKSAKEITYSFGFSDPSNFNRFFKRNTGTTPQQFQKGTS